MVMKFFQTICIVWKSDIWGIGRIIENWACDQKVTQTDGIYLGAHEQGL